MGPAQHHRRAAHAFSDMPEFGQDLCQRGALRQPDADLSIARQLAGGGQHQIAQPGQAHECLGARTERHAEPCHFCHAARDQGSARVQSQAHAVAQAGGDGQHVFHRPADFDPDQIAGCVDAQAVAVQRFDGQTAQPLVQAGRDQRRRLAAGHLDGEAGTRQRADRHRQVQRASHFVAEPAGAVLESFAQPIHARAAGPQHRQHLVQRRHRRGDDQQAVAGMAQGADQVTADLQRRRQHDAGQVARIATHRPHLRRLRRIAGPQSRAVARRSADRQRGAPGAGAEHRQVHAAPAGLSSACWRGRRHSPTLQPEPAGLQTLPGNSLRTTAPAGSPHACRHPRRWRAGTGRRCPGKRYR